MYSERCGRIAHAGMLQNVYRLASGLLPRLYRGSVLFGGSVVSGPGVNLDGRQSFGRVQLHLDLPPDATVMGILRFISEDILVAQLGSDLRCDIGQISQLRYREDATTRHFHEF